ncbi:methylphosphotriester-DNA alkyltransferase [Bacillus toyonensis]|nr:methylphosphotriester-DNA alkyltransferase [Bacillus toyonensis]PGA10841.1 methylphosphotriester-DNA alkyltransferase [Bacillus toyonensis]PGA58474.1 methylphosphotriester-DNA alkyltransferase [Bacillus toyonensis]PGB34177.1 methylphosphotriester-DNA alkyltransferase [Bacillus toyonensis]PGC02889.1 methylphosphotriester-DNA alkyltransferase [Bacillus toyonensis]
MRKQNKPTVVNAIDEINLTDERWWAIIQNDASYNGKFYYAVKTTKLICLPSCQSRIPNGVCILPLLKESYVGSLNESLYKLTNWIETRLLNDVLIQKDEKLKLYAEELIECPK